MKMNMEDKLSILNPYPKKMPGQALLHHLVASDIHDGRTAIEYEISKGVIERLTYQDLHQRANCLAQILQSIWKSSPPSLGSRIIAPIFIQQCPYLYVAELATLKAGGAFCPISLDVPEGRLRFILQDVSAKVLLTTTQLQDRLPSLEGISIITVDDICLDLCGDMSSPNIDASQPAYVMYTSGSTGQPKGVVISHSAATQALLAHDRHIPHFTRCLQFASPTFDVSVFEIFFPLFRRATLVCGDRRQLLNDLSGFIDRMNVDAAELTPSVVSSLLQNRDNVPTLKLLLTIGEMLKRDVVEEFGSSPTEDGILSGMYGPTEATIHCTLQPTFSTDMPVGNIGVPLDTVSTFVVKPHGSESSSNGSIDIVSIGEEGELALGGYQLAEGYLNRPEQTRAAFVQHPHYGKLYRTGDRAKLTTGGTLLFLGRISDGQVKIRGQRIELGEIEYAVAKAPSCQTAVANIVNGMLVAFCVCVDNAVKKDDIRSACCKWLPAFMVPTEFILLEKLPYLDSGKVDNKSLEELFADRNRDRIVVNGVDPPLMHKVIDIISDVLNVQVESQTKLARMGLDSLSAISLCSRLKQSGFPQPDAIALLQSHTVEDVVNELDRLGAMTEHKTHHVEIFAHLWDSVSTHPYTSDSLSDIDDVFAATPIQSAMLLETARDREAYCNWIEFEVDANFSFDMLVKSINELAQLHVLLRSGLLQIAGDEFTHAVVVWKSLLSSQVRQVDGFEYHFNIADEKDLLRPCDFQLRSCSAGARILLRIHHALYDQWSLDVLRRDLHQLLLSRSCTSRPSFRDMSAYFAKHRKYALSSHHLEFWQEHLREFEPTLLPSMNGKRMPRKLQSSPWRNLQFDFSQLKSESSQIGCNVPVLFQAAFAYLTGCYTGSTDVGLGVVFSGRHLPIFGIQAIFGPCLATLPLRINYSTTRSCLDLLRLVQSQNRQLQKHSLTRLADVKRMAEHRQSESLFDILFVWQETSLDFQLDFQDVREVDSADNHEFNLVLEIKPSNNGIRARATFQKSLISLAQVEMLITQVEALVDAMINSPDSLVDDLPSCFAKSSLSISNPKPKSSSIGLSLIAAIEQHATQHPSSVALVFATNIDPSNACTKILTYEDLIVRANKLANFIASLQKPPDELICICMEKSVDLYLAILATIKAGSGYLPLVPNTPPSRIRTIIDQANIKYCLCDNMTQRLFDDSFELNSVDITALNLENFASQNLAISFPSHHLAYSIFTSGSTGQPKGVAVTMGNLLSNIEVLSELYKVESGDRILQSCSQAFDVSVFEIFFAFYTGITLCAAPKDVLFHDLEASIRVLNISHLSLTPTVAALIDPSNVPGVRFLITAGEAVTDRVHDLWASRDLHQGYGPSETTNICAVNMDVKSEDALGNIGVPLRNTSAFVISPDSGFKILPIGSVGEFAFGGEQVFRGYIGMDQLNAEKIVFHPKHGRIYRSGDTGRILPDGSLLIRGRLDDQVKIRGNRVELEEINSIVIEKPIVRDCTTLVVGQESPMQSLATFIVPKDIRGDAVDNTELAEVKRDMISGLFDRLQDALPSYMIPTVIVPVTKLPRTSQDKLDRRNLLRLLEGLEKQVKARFSRENEGIGGDQDEGWPKEERRVASVLADILQIDMAEVSRHRSFFALGLNSLNAIAFARLVSRNLKTDTSVSTVLRNSTVSRLTQAIHQRAQKTLMNGHVIQRQLLPSSVVEDAREVSPYSKEDIEVILPCTPLQESMLLAQTSKERSVYCNSTVLRVNGNLSRLKRCWTDMISRHPILRTRFLPTETASNPHVQIVLKDADLPWHEHQLDSVNDLRMANPFEHVTAQKLDHSNPLCVQILKTDKDAKMVLHMHHAIYDGISMSLLLEEVEQLYHGKTLAPPSSFETFLEEAKAQSGEDAMNWWAQQLQNFQPKLFAQPSTSHQQEAHKLQRLLPISRADLATYCNRHALSQLAILQAAMVKSLAFLQDVSDVCFGNVVSGRTVPVEGVERLVAPCFNTIPVRVDMDKVNTNLELSQSLNRFNVEALAYQLTPLRQIQTLSKLPTRHLFDALLILQPPSHSLNPDIWTFEQEDGAMDVPLVFEIVQVDEAYQMVLHYSLSATPDSLAEDIFKTLVSALKSCLIYPAASVAYLHNISKTDCRGKLVVEDGGLEEEPSRQVPRSDVGWSRDEDLIREVFARLSGLDKDSIQQETSLYQIGLDSLNAAQVASQLRTQGVVLDAIDVMEKQTPAALAAVATSRVLTTLGIQEQDDLEAFDWLHREDILERMGLHGRNLEAIRPCTPVQNGMIAQSVQSNGKFYVNHVTYRVPNSVTVPKLRTAWKEVTSRHQVLRMGFHQLDDLHTPFAMSILTPGFALCPYHEAKEALNLKAAESYATSHIMGSIGTQGWLVQILQQPKERLMTLSLHHALYDAESLRLILDDLEKCLSSSNLEPSDDIDKVLSAALREATDENESSKNFWTAALKDSTVTKFPDLSPTIIESVDLQSEQHICKNLLSSVEHFCRENAATLQAVGQTAWALLLAAYTGDTNVTFGTIFSGQQTSTVHRVAFPSIVTVPVPCDNDHSPLQVLRKMMEYNTSAQRHRFVPLAQLQQLAGHATQPLFDTIFVYQKQSQTRTTFDWPVVKESAGVDYTASLELEVSPRDEIVLRLTYDPARIPNRHAELMLQQYEHILLNMVRGELGNEQFLWSVIPAEEPFLRSPSPLLHGLVEQTVQHFPDRQALEFIYEKSNVASSRKAWTYKDLDARGNQVAHLIHSFGVEPGSIVALSIDKCPEASFAFLGILKAGCSFLAIDPDLPAARLEFILEDSGASLLFVDKSRSLDISLEEPPVVGLTESELLKFPSSSVRSAPIPPEATCYCLYTSGTTGTPKGCEITHENAVQAMMAFQKLFARRWTESSRWLQFASYWFDVSVLEQFWSWSVGITVVSASRDLVLEDLPGFLNEQNVTHLDLTPSLARLLNPEDVPSLWDGVFITGGEALKQEIIETWGPKRAICNGYGPTEATIGVTMNTFIGSDAKPSNIGPPFVNVGAYVLKPGSDEPVLCGAVGELCVSGKLVGKGYLNRPELTEKHFPFLPRFGERVYRTGDLVRALAEGSFSFIGRQDSQTKLRGQRLEIAEIDKVIQQSNESITHVVSIVAKSGHDGKETLVSFITDSPKRRSDTFALGSSKELRRLATVAKEACLNQLPGYMVPTHILPLDFMPLTVNNKIDAKQLTSLFTSTSIKDLRSLDDGIIEDRTESPIEQRVLGVLAKLLRIDIEDISGRSNLFSLGLSSITAISFSNLMKRAGFNNASVATIMSNPTIRQLSVALNNNPSKDLEEDRSVKQAKLRINAFTQRYRSIAARHLGYTLDEIETVVPCTPLQQGLIVESLRDNNRPYFNDFCYVLKDLEISRLQHALRHLTEAAQVLRTHFFETEEGFAQVVLVTKICPVAEHAVREEEELGSFLLERKNEWTSRNMSQLTHLFEAQIVQTPAATYLVIHIHHALYDGISYELLLEYLTDMYGSGRQVDSGPSFIESLPYGPLRQAQGAKSFWSSRLESYQYVPLPAVGEPAPKEDQYVSYLLQEDLDLETTRKNLGVTHQALVQSCFEIALRQCVPMTRTYGIVVSGRSIELEGADKILGPMFNTLPQPVRSVNAATTVAEYVLDCHSMNVQTLPYQHTPLRDIRRWCGRNSSDPMFDVLFVFQNETASNGPNGRSRLQLVEKRPRAGYPLAFEVEMHHDRTMIVTILAKALNYNQDALESILRSFKIALDATVHDGDAKVAEKFGLATNSDCSKTILGRQTTEKGSQSAVNGTREFLWEPQALTIREEIARVAGVDADEIDEHTSIFAIGLDSIDAVKLAARLKKAGIAIPMSKILQAQSIKRMLGTIQQGGKAEDVAVTASELQAIEEHLNQVEVLPETLTVHDIERILPATPNQEALIVDMYRSELREYFNHDVLRLRPETDLRRLKRAWQTVVDATPILRTSFVEVSMPQLKTVFAQVAHQSSPLKFESIERDNVQDLDDVFEKIRFDVLRNFQATPPLRLTVCFAGPERYLILSLAHALYDGHSLALLHEYVERAYDDSFTVRMLYDDVVEAALTATNVEAERFWTGTLTGANPQMFPTPWPNGRRHQVHRAEVESNISAAAARSFCQQHTISMQALAQTCWALTLAHYTRSMEVLYGVVLACRDSEQAEETMFPTMNTIVVRASLHGTREQMLQYMQGLITDVLPYQRTPLRMIQASGTKVVQKHDTLPANGLFDTLFIYQHRPTSQDLHEPLYDSVGGASNVEYPVAVEMEDVDDKLVIRAACKDYVMDYTGTKELLRNVDEVLQAIVKSPEEPTVSFEADMVSICGLGLFQPQPSNTNTKPKVPAETEALDGHEGEDSPLTSSIIEIFAQVSNVSTGDITSTTSIESIGIDSISAIKVAALLRKRSISLSVSEIIRAKTPARIAKIIESKPTQNACSTSPSKDIILDAVKDYSSGEFLGRNGFDVAKVEYVMPATAGQMYMLSMWHKTGGQTFCSTFSYQVETSVTSEKVEEAWKKVVGRHAILRTVFCATGDNSMPLLQIVLRNSPNSYETRSRLREKSPGTQPLVSLEAQQNEAGFLFSLRIHHALYDAISLPLIVQDLQNVLSEKEPAVSKLKSEDYIAFSVTKEARQYRKDFWTEYLKDVKPMHLQQSVTDGRHKRVEIFKLGIFSNAADLEKIARKESLSTQALLFAAYAKVYAMLIEQAPGTTATEADTDVVLGIYLSNRSHLADLKSLPAPTVNLVPLLVRSPQQKSLLDVARQIQADLQEIGTPERSAVGLWEIFEWTGIKVDTFVNFLKLPDIGNDDASNEGRECVVIREIDERRTEERSRVVEPLNEEFNVPVELQSLEGMDAYKHSVDIEMTITDGKLDVGLFCPEDMIDLEQANEALEEFRRVLEKLAGKAKQ